MSIVNTQAFRTAQSRHDNAEPDYSGEAHDMAIEGAIEDTWQTHYAIKEVFDAEGVRLSLAACQLLVRHREVRFSRGRRGRPLAPHEFQELADALIEAIEPVIEREAERTVERAGGGK